MKYILTLIVFVNVCCYGQGVPEFYITDGKEDTSYHPKFFVDSDNHTRVLILSDSALIVYDSLAAIKTLLKSYFQICKQLREQVEKFENIPNTYFQQAAYMDTIPLDTFILLHGVVSYDPPHISTYSMGDYTLPDDTTVNYSDTLVMRDYYDWETSDFDMHKYDTVKVQMLVTNIVKGIKKSTFIIFYDVRKPSGMMAFENGRFDPESEWTHYKYLDADKKPFKKGKTIFISPKSKKGNK